MFRLRYSAVVILIVAGILAFFVWNTTGKGGRFDFKLGLDLSGGSQLVYTADTSKVEPGEVPNALSSLREVIERRVNAYGVGEPIVQTVQGGVVGTGAHRLIVELPGITDVEEAARRIGATPLLEFKLIKQGMETQVIDAEGNPNPEAFEDTGLTGEFLVRATPIIVPVGSGLPPGPAVSIKFNGEGTRLMSEVTAQKNWGRSLATFLDGEVIQVASIGVTITDGEAVVTGIQTPEAAQEFSRNLNFGALPVPIALESTQTIGATLGDEAVRAGVVAGIAGFIALALFMIFWYRLPGLVAVISLAIYVILMLVLFKLIPVVLTAAGIAAFILSVGLAVDANVLIAERLKEELKAGKKADAAIREGFSRAWLAIRDSNIAHIIAAVILFWFGTSLVKGFALVFGIGVLVSMFSAITISRTFLLALGVNTETKWGRFLLRSGLTK